MNFKGLLQDLKTSQFLNYSLCEGVDIIVLSVFGKRRNCEVFEEDSKDKGKKI